MHRSGCLVITVSTVGHGDTLSQLHGDLRRAGIAAEPAAASTPPGAKSGVGTVTSLVLSGLISAAGLRTLSQVLLASVRRAEKRRIEIRRGDEVFILEAGSARDGHVALEAWLRRTDSAAEIDEA
ncbi:hypothetical protein [Actinoplanes sp. ATCC 53533]|uniref:hypothetical protein n=1 Tax=Actinoplanes sp. ATCC 53533 TaxID=1288362 RepID=UPI000F774D04|nr:hypothetical protein [Actinoplanes sp. ATCC 53533]